MKNTRGKLIRRARSRLGWTQSELARRLGERGYPVCKNAVSNWEHGKRRPSRPGILADLLGIAVRDLVE